MSSRENFIRVHGKKKYNIFRQTAENQFIPKQADICRACALPNSTVSHYFYGVMGITFEEFQAAKFSKLEKKVYPPPSLELNGGGHKTSSENI